MEQHVREDSLLTTMSSILLHILTANACKRKTAIDCGNCPEPCSPREKMPVVFLCCFSSAASLHFPPGYMHSMTHCLMVSLKQKNIDTVMIIFNHKLQSIQQSLNVLHPSKPLQGPPAPPHAVPWRNYFSFLKDNSCSKCSSRCSWVSQNEICRSEQEAVIVFFDVPSRQPFSGWKSHFTILTDCLAGASLETATPQVQPGAPRGQRYSVQTRDFVAFYLWTSGYKSQITPWMKTIISKKSLFVYITPPMQNLANSEALMRNSSQETQARLKVGWGEGRMRRTRPG